MYIFALDTAKMIQKLLFMWFSVLLLLSLCKNVGEQMLSLHLLTKKERSVWLHTKKGEKLSATAQKRRESLEFPHIWAEIISILTNYVPYITTYLLKFHMKVE